MYKIGERSRKFLLVVGSIIAAILLWLLFSYISIINGINIGELIGSGYFNNWEKTSAPNGKISDLRLGENNELLLEMENKELYEWYLSTWKKIEKPSGKGPLGMSCNTNGHDYQFIQKYSITSVKRITLDCFSGDIHDHYELILSTNNEVWIWRWTTGDLSFYYILPPFFISLCINIIMLIITIIIEVSVITKIVK